MLNEWLTGEASLEKSPLRQVLHILQPTQNPSSLPRMSKTSKNYLSSPRLVSIADICSCCTRGFEYLLGTAEAPAQAYGTPR